VTSERAAGKPARGSRGKPPSASARGGAVRGSSGTGRPAGASGRGSGKPGSGKPGSSRSGKPSSDKPRSGKPSSDKPRSDRPRSDKPRSDKPRSDKPRSDKLRSDSSRSDKPRSDRPDADRPRGGRPGGERAGGAGKPRGDRGTGGGKPRTGTGKPRTERTTSAAGHGALRRDPHIPDEVTADHIDPAIANELRTLPEGLAEIVARHLVAADLALVDEDIPLAREHIQAAKRRAGRVAAVREAAGVTAYLAGDYAEAIAELRTVRRMTGSVEYVPMLADCERGLGRPQRALDLIREVDQRTVDPATRVELILVLAGARADMGQLDAAVLTLQIPELTKLPKGGPRARLQYAYADLLERVGRVAESREWMRKAAASDKDGVTDAAERVEEEAGLAFSEEELGAEPTPEGP
jgi:hypothetical protein